MMNVIDAKKQTDVMVAASKDVHVPKSIIKLKMDSCPLVVDCLHRQTKCGHCVDKSNYEWDFTQMI